MKKLLNVTEAATYLGLKKPTLDRWRSEGRPGPAFIKTGRRVGYETEELDRFIDKNRHSSTSTYNPPDSDEDDQPVV